MVILVIDAQGGGVGKQLVSSIKHNIPTAYVTAIGTKPFMPERVPVRTRPIAYPNA